MKKFFIILMTLATLALSTASYADVTVKFFNNSNKTKIYALNWDNHPYGCYNYYGKISCEYTIAMGELKSGKTDEMVLKDDYIETGNTFTIKWRDLSSDPDQSKLVIYHFKITDDLVEIVTTPDGE